MQCISALLTVFKMFEIRCSPLRTLRDRFDNPTRGRPAQRMVKLPRNWVILSLAA